MATTTQRNTLAALETQIVDPMNKVYGVHPGHSKPRRHDVDAVITARKEHVARCDRSGDQGGKAVVNRFRGAIADHQPHTLSSPAKACGDRQDERFDRICWLGRRVGHYARHDCGSIEPHQDLGLANLDLLDQGSHAFAKLE